MTILKDNKIIKLSDIEHILLRPNMYIGSVSLNETEEYIYDKDINKIKLKGIKFVPGLIKIINEIIDNSIDESIRTHFKFANLIKVKIDNKSVEIQDNGRGIPVEKMSNSDEYMPVVAFTHPRAGANFEDDRDTIGMNGIGAVATNVFSSYFEVKTADGKNQLTLKCKSNLKEFHFSIKKSDKQFTKVYFEPDLKRFGLEEITEETKLLIEQRLLFLSLIYPQISFVFNDKKIKFKTKKEFLKLFSDDFEVFEQDNYFIAVLPNEYDDFKFFSIVNGLLLKNGGTHVDFIINNISSQIRDKIKLKNKDFNILPGDIKNKLFLIVFFNQFKDTKFDSQSKEKLTNSISEIKNYLSNKKDIDIFNSKEFDTFINKIFKNEKIIDPIIETFKIKEEFKKRKELSSLAKKSKSIYLEKYLPPIKEKKYLVLGEGDSAVGGISKILGRKEFGYFALKGKPLNAFEVSLSKLLENEELTNIIKILEVDLNNKNHEISFENILIATDQDLDGILIRGLLLAFFYKFMPKLLEEKRIKFLNTPMIILFKNKKPVEMFFDFDSYNLFKNKNDLSKYEIVYYKGLGTFEGNELKMLIEEKGLSYFIDSFEIDEKAIQLLKEWMSKDTSDKRKEYLRNKVFDLFKL